MRKRTLFTPTLLPSRVPSRFHEKSCYKYYDALRTCADQWELACRGFDFHSARLLVAELRQAEEEGAIRSLAWVVMPDHFHWLVELGPGSLKRLMRRVKSRSTMMVNRHNGRSGRLWQKGFHDRTLSREEDVQTVARYIVLNPKRAGLVARVGDYPHWDAIWV